MAALPFLLSVSGCAGNNVAVEPLALPNIAPGLMRDPGASPCQLPKRTTYQPGEVGAYIECVHSDREHIHKRLTGLQRAVRVRETSIQKALKANKS